MGLRLLPIRFSLATTFFALAICTCVFASAQDGGDEESATHYLRDDEPLYKQFRDDKFPFLEATVDLRGAAPIGNEDNLVPRAVVIALGDDVYVCFDTELLRVAGIWKGGFLTPDSMAMLSYSLPLEKIPPGQGKLPRPEGEVMVATGLYPGWHRAGKESTTDPRSRWNDPSELGRGPLAPEVGQWIGVYDSGAGVTLSYSLYGGVVRERFETETVGGKHFVRREIEMTNVELPLSLVIQDAGESAVQASRFHASAGAFQSHESRRLFLQVPSGDGLRRIDVRYSLGDHAAPRPRVQRQSLSPLQTASRWGQRVTTSFALGPRQGSYAVDELKIPYPNPWHRRIRPVGIDFFPDGDAVVVTFDGDVYRLGELGNGDGSVTLRRIAAGFNEPHSIRIRDGEIFVFSRLGITRLVDRDGDGETDFYEMFCNRFNQSADTRDYPMSLALRPGGSFLISKGGQQSDARSPHSGRILEISPNGKEVSYFAYGLRNGYVTVHPETGLVTASDQQGNWVPASPVHIVRRGSFLGYQPGAPEWEAPLQEPALWIPHRVAPSGMGHVWGVDARMGALQGSLLYIDYKLPGITKVMMRNREPVVRAAATPLDIEFETPLIKGAVNPRDGQAYFVGFQIWDSMAKRLEGIARLRVEEKADHAPVQALAFSEGALLSFSKALDPVTARDLSNFEVNSWEYRRTESYGSPQLKTNGEAGIDERPIHSVLVSKDRKSLFIAIDDLRPTMQLETRYRLFGSTNVVYFTLDEMFAFQPEDNGFEPIDFRSLFAADPSPRGFAGEQDAVRSAEYGRALAAQYGCIGCHSTDASSAGRSGPGWQGLYGSDRALSDGTTVKADSDYLKQSIIEPEVHIVAGYADTDVGMPSYKGALEEEEVESLVLYIESLK